MLSVPILRRLRSKILQSRLGQFAMYYAPLLKMFTDQDGIMICKHEPLSKHSTWRIGGPADLLIEPSNCVQLSKIFRFAEEKNVPSLVIGKGSNLLFDDAGFRGIVIKIGRKLSDFSIDGIIVRAEAGIAICKLARATGLAGLTGLEHTVGIPGTLGGLVTMNGGSQRKSIGDVIRWVEVMDHYGNTYRVSREKCNFSYRHSAFQSTDLVVVEAQMELGYGDPDAIRSEMLTILRNRRAKFPRKFPNCGSVFASTPEMYKAIGPPGKVIEEAGLKGLRVGNAEVSRKHANFIVNTGNAKASDVRELIYQVRVAVHSRTGTWMESEVRYVSGTGEICLAHEAS